MPTVNLAGDKRFTFCVKRYCGIFSLSIGTLFHNHHCSFILFRRYYLQFGYNLGTRISTAKNTCICQITKNKLFENSVSVHNVVETEYIEGSFGYDFSKHIAWLYEENTGAFSKEEYDEFIRSLEQAQKDGSYIFSKPYYIYKGVKI